MPVSKYSQRARSAFLLFLPKQISVYTWVRFGCSSTDKPKAVTAAAHKLPRLIFTMLTKGEEYTDQGQARNISRKDIASGSCTACLFVPRNSA